MDLYGADELIPLCLCLTPYLLVGLVVAIVLAARRKQPTRDGLPVRSQSEQELDHVDYALAQLEEAKDDNAVDGESYAELHRRLMARRQQVLQITLAEVEQVTSGPFTMEPAATPAASAAPTPESPWTEAGGAVEESSTGQSSALRDAAELREPLTLARVTRWLLYLGVFLLFIATIIFAVYRWESFPEWVKFAILLTVTAFFYAGGWYVRIKLGNGGGGLALIVVGAIMSFFDGYIYLSSRSRLDDPSAWTVCLVVLAGIYLAVALLTPSRLLLCFSGLAQAAAVVCAGRHYYLNARGSQLGVVATFGTLLMLALLAFLWLIVWGEVEEKRGRGRLFLTTLFVSAHGLVLVASAVYLLTLLAVTVESKLPAGFIDAPRDLFKMTGQIFALQIAFDVVVAAFLAFDWWRTKRADYLYAMPAVAAAALLSCLLFAGTPVRYFPLAFSLLALGLLLAGWLTKATGVAGFLERQLVVPAYVLAVLVGICVFPYLAVLVVFAGKWSAAMGSDVRLLTCLTLGAFFLVGAVYQRSRYPVYPGAAFLALFYLLALARLKLDARYVPLALVVLALAWLVRSWWMKQRDLFDFVRQPLGESSYAIASLVGVVSLFEVIDAVESGSIRSAASIETILVFVLLAAFFALATAYWQREGHVYPALLSVTIACQLVFARTAIDMRYEGFVIALLGPVYLAGGVISHRYGLERFSRPLLVSTYAISLYALALSLVDQPTLIAVLLVNATLYIATAFATLAGPEGAWGRLGRSTGGAAGGGDEESRAKVHGDSSADLPKDVLAVDTAHLWLALLQLTAALFVALDYQRATHLRANVVYVSFYLGIFAVSLFLRQSELGFGRRWGEHLVVFAALFCAGQLVMQTLISAGSTEQIFPLWTYSTSTGPDILMFAYVIAGFFYVAAAQVYPYEILTYGGFLFFLAAYVVKLFNLDVTMIEWYSVPIALYVLAMGHVHERAHPRQRVTAVSNPIGTLIMLGAPTLAFMATAQGPTAQLHATAAGVLSILFIAGGIVGRNKVFFFGGILFLAWDALYQSWEYLYALPKWATIGTLGLAMLVAAIYLERRREHVLDLARRARKTLTEEWK